MVGGGSVGVVYMNVWLLLPSSQSECLVSNQSGCLVTVA